MSSVAGNIVVGNPASIATPPAGEVTLFLNTSDGNILSYKDELGAVYRYSEGSLSVLGEDCCCEIAEKIVTDLGCALKDGMITAADYQAAINQGISVVGASTDDGNGNTTCSMVISAANVPVTGVVVTPATINPLAVGNQAVAVATIAPSNASNKTVIWSSGNVLRATVDQNGVITGVAAGAVTITATTADGLFTDTCVVTVV